MRVDETPKNYGLPMFTSNISLPMFDLNEKEWLNFTHCIENPPKPNEELKKLLRELKPTPPETEGTDATH